jgi:hypothetical protein
MHKNTMISSSPASPTGIASAFPSPFRKLNLKDINKSVAVEKCGDGLLNAEGIDARETASLTASLSTWSSYSELDEATPSDCKDSTSNSTALLGAKQVLLVENSSTSSFGLLWQSSRYNLK